ncbi:hypothetical protein ABZ905_36990 [Streptomyces parvus]|uniref:hypothetical protein n=1 Tax=Streptomyces parvus TaxID=66428 RepID=UPI0033F989AE
MNDIRKDWPGQLIHVSTNGHIFRHDPGAKGGKVYAPDGETLLAHFLYVDAGDENTPLGVYIGDGTTFTYADTYDGASAYLIARAEYAEETMYRAGYRFTWDDAGDTATAIPDDPNADPYGRATGTVRRQGDGRYVAYAPGDERGFQTETLDVAAGYLWGWHIARGTFDLPPDPDKEPRRLVDPSKLVITEVREVNTDE